MHLLRHAHAGETLHDGRFLLLGCRFAAVVLASGVDERAVGIRRGRGRHGDAALHEELAQLERNVAAGDERGQLVHRDPLQRALRGVTDFGVGIAGEQREQSQLLQRARRNRTLRGEQPHVPRHFPALQEIE
jgi:hypothetical protein